MWHKRLGLLVLGTWGVVLHAYGQPLVDAKTVTKELVCTCGCGNMIVANCSCAEADRVRSEVAALAGEGLSSDEILERFAEKYGMEVLAAPPARGFGLSAWILPFAALAFGIYFLTARLRRWAMSVPPVASPDRSGLDDRYAEILEREIREA